MNAELLLAHFNRISDTPDAIPRLRSFVLELAVRGRLAGQYPKDEPVSKLIDRIEIANGDMPFDIPSGWIWVRLGAICSKTGSGSTPRGGRAVYQPTGVPFLRSQNIYNDGLRLDDVAYITQDGSGCIRRSRTPVSD
jgi:type I restriction enzyme S subunit